MSRGLLSRMAAKSRGDRASHRRPRRPPDVRRCSAQPSNVPTRTPGTRIQPRVPTQSTFDPDPAISAMNPRMPFAQARPQSGHGSFRPSVERLPRKSHEGGPGDADQPGKRQCESEIRRTHEYHENLRRIAFRQVLETLQHKAPLRAGHTLDEATDTFMTIYGDSTYHLHQRTWSEPCQGHRVAVRGPP
jgi:hypothetical protein